MFLFVGWGGGRVSFIVKGRGCGGYLEVEASVVALVKANKNAGTFGFVDSQVEVSLHLEALETPITLETDVDHLNYLHIHTTNVC